MQVRVPGRQQRYEIKIGPALLSELGFEARAVFGSESQRVVLVSNQTVFDLYGERVINSLESSGFKIAPWLMKEGEQHKSLKSFAQLAAFLGASGLERGDAIISLGGGVVGDLAGFAAATFLRGIGFIQVPTTLLAQIDASVGGKTGVNLAAGKNLVGAFHQPKLVLVDVDTLKTLPAREITSGWCEAVKQGAVGDRKLFERTARLLRSAGASIGRTDLDLENEVCDVIAAHCRFKAAIVRGDEREAIGRDDSRSRRILNFGHTIAHGLETVTGYRRFRHGEAVGYGMIAAAEISKDLGMLPSEELESLRAAVRLCGPLPPAGDVAVEQVLAAISADKKSVQGVIKWVLLERIGQARIVSGKEIGHRLIRSATRKALASKFHHDER